MSQNRGQGDSFRLDKTLNNSSKRKKDNRKVPICHVTKSRK